MKIELFEDLEIWQDARDLCKVIRDYSVKESLSKDYRLKDQLCSSSGSIMDNIAEGFERNGNKEFVQFLGIAKGSCGETRSQSYRAFDYKYINQEELDLLLVKTTNLSKKISGFISYLRKIDFKGSKYN